LITSTVEICVQQLGRVEEMFFTARRSYASAVLGVVILSICPSVRPSVRLSHACFVTNAKNLPAIFLYSLPHERAIILVKCDFSYSCAAADKISTDLRRRAVPLRQLSYLLEDGAVPSSFVSTNEHSVQQTFLRQHTKTVQFRSNNSPNLHVTLPRTKKNSESVDLPQVICPQ